ncbi:MAG: efflux transporter outer membrane subunit [Deltaproteobacteria bacterium]|nr:efflux transporter outer membrane subunit [Deltaproteobacteria bacterium]
MSLSSRVLAAIFLAAATMLAVSCSLSPSYNRPQAPVPATLGVPSPAEPEVVLPPWQQFFPEERLKSLVKTALTENRDLKLAALRIQQAAAQYGVIGSERFPMFEAQGNSDFAGGGGGRRTTEDYEVGIMLPSFELDFFGRIANMTQAARENYLSSVEAARYARIALLTSVAGAYLDTRLAQERLKLTQRNLASWRSSRAFIEERIISGQSSLLDLEQARAMVAFAEAESVAMELEIVRSENALKLILGDFQDHELPPALPLLSWPISVLPEGLSSANLLSRPDILEAEHRLIATHADIGAAKAAFFPRISLTGALGFMSMELSSLFDPGNDRWSTGAAVSIPIFSGGRNRANLKLAEVEREMAIVEYEMVVQTAFKEVKDALEVRKLITERVAAQRKYLSAQRRVLELATNRYQSGVISYLEVLEAQRDVFEGEMTLLGLRREQIFNDLSLYSALGGGFPDEPSTME